MTKPRVLSQMERAFLRQAVENGEHYTSMATSLGVCVDTLKRILQREGLAEFEGAKYAVSMTRSNKKNVWVRPCMKCKDDRPRPKWQYFCDKCRATLDDDDTEYRVWD
jgi:IS30 family transposase